LQLSEDVSVCLWFTLLWHVLGLTQFQASRPHKYTANIFLQAFICFLKNYKDMCATVILLKELCTVAQIYLSNLFTSLKGLWH